MNLRRILVISDSFNPANSLVNFLQRLVSSNRSKEDIINALTIKIAQVVEAHGANSKVINADIGKFSVANKDCTVSMSKIEVLDNDIEKGTSYDLLDVNGWLGELT